MFCPDAIQTAEGWEEGDPLTVGPSLLAATGVLGTVVEEGADVAKALRKGRRVDSPNPAMRRWAQEGEFIDPRTNRPIAFDGTLQADHVYPQSRIRSLAEFDTLSEDQQDFLLNYPGNFEPLPGSWNASKKNRLAAEWANTPMGKSVHPDYLRRLEERQNAFEEFANETIEFFRSGR